MADHGSFSGEPETRWLTEDGVADRRMCLLAPFSFTDPSQRIWEVPEGYDRMNGASIPRPLWGLVGPPYVGDYRRASIVHDYACDQSEGDPEKRRQADRMFYHACRAGGCTVREAMLLYIGVRIGALLPRVERWKTDKAADVGRPRLCRGDEERQMEGDFRRTSEQVLSAGETDDPIELERRVDQALSTVTGLDLTSK